jgi:hypothetical protein
MLWMGWWAGGLLTDCDFMYFVGYNGYSLPRATQLSLWDFFEQRAKGPLPPRAGLVQPSTLQHAIKVGLRAVACRAIQLDTFTS